MRMRLEPGASGMTPDGVWWCRRGHGPGLVLLNGYGAYAGMWPSSWLADLQARHTVIRIDPRGGGWSRFASVPFTLADLAADVVATLDAAEVDTAVLLGLSMGGMVAQETALRAPHRVTGLVLAGTRPPVPEFVHPPISSSVAFVRGPRRGERLADFQRRLWTTAVAPGFAAGQPALVEEIVEQSVARPTPRAMLLQQMRAMVGWGHAERLRGLDVPTEIVHGAEDRFSVPANGHALAGLIPEAGLEILPGVGHLVPLEAPGRLDAAIDRVLRRAAERR